LRSIPSKDETFSRLGSLKGLWYETLHSAILDTSRHYEANADHREDQPLLFSAHVRSRFLTLLEPKAEEFSFSIVPLQGGGFYVAYSFFVCKFLKAFNGDIPLPTTKTQLRFYNANRGLSMQQTLPWGETVKPPLPIGSTISLIVYYDVTTGTYREKELDWIKVACPRFATFNRVDTEWNDPLDNPLFGEDESFHVKRATNKRKDLMYEKLEDDTTPTELIE
jgi:hypothetical protein